MRGIIYICTFLVISLNYFLWNVIDNYKIRKATIFIFAIFEENLSGD